VREAADNGEEVDTGKMEKIREKYQEALNMSDKKIELASSAYDLLDRHIRKLDGDLRKFELELEQKELNLTAAERRKRKLQTGVSAAEQRKHFATEAYAPVSVGRKARSAAAGVARSFDVALDMPIDPNEPTYCICNRVAFGEMVGCDNPDCKREWFHFECVGLVANPTGKWLCPECSSLKRKQVLQ
jgi:inhibitor of growth protein 4